MGADGVGDVTDVDGVQVLVVTCLLNEDLKMKAAQFNPSEDVFLLSLIFGMLQVSTDSGDSLLSESNFSISSVSHTS